MVLADPAAARWPTLHPGRGHYESYYLRAVDPTRPRGVWIRYTVSAAPGGPPTGHLWFTFFDRAATRPRAVRVDAGEPTTGGGAWIRLGESTFGPGAVEGQAGPAGQARWSLRTSADQPLLRHLPRDWMYSARLPRTKLLSLCPATVFTGTLEVDGETIDVSGWPGMVGHNWGEQHAAQWIWLHGLAFEGAGPDTWLDVAVARVRLGPVTTPWVANGAVSLGGERIPLGGLRRRVVVDAEASRCELQIPGVGATVSVSASAPPAAFVEWDYPDPHPERPAHRVLNCSVADLTVRVARPGAEPVGLQAPGRGAYELGREDAAARLM